MRKNRLIPVGLLILILSASSISAQEPIYWDVVQKIMEEEFENSHAMDNASWLSDVFGARNSKTPSYIEAAKWVKERLEEYGLSDARLEPYEFGTGWENKYTSVHLMAPNYMPIIAYPAPWTAGTDGKVRAPVIYINFNEITSEADLQQYRGKLRDKIIFTVAKQDITPHFEPMARIFTKEQLDEMAQIPIGPRASEERYRRRSRDEDRLSRKQIVDFVAAEGAVAVVRTDGRRDFGTVDAGVDGYTVSNRLWEVDVTPPLADLVMAAEHYNRIMRILEREIPVEMEVEIRVNFIRGDPHDYNVVAEIPGSDLAHEIVVCGAHLQSEPVGTGATDNAAGTVVAMEAVRILKTLGVKPRRTIRVGLWGGHEMGLFGNRAHVRKHFADPETKEYKADYHNLCAYFNVDHGSGRIRGVSIMGSEATRSILAEWIKPLKALGMSHLFTTGMAHEAYSEVGLPGFYFVQDRMDMETNVHSNMDMYDRLVEENLMVNSVILATLVYHAAMRDEKLPRIAPLPWD
jgi:carboxypeptidase Q